MKRLTALGIGIVSSFALGSCAGDYPYPAPVGSTLDVSPTTISIAGSGGVYLLEAVVKDKDGNLLNQILVNVEALAGSDNIEGSNYVLVPETAILGQSQDDTTWQVDAAEQYFELTQVNDEIQPNFLQTATDNHGIARVYLYPRCIPTDCGSSTYGPVNSCFFEDPSYPFDDVVSELSGRTCSGQSASLSFSIGVAAKSITVSTGYKVEIE